MRRAAPAMTLALLLLSVAASASSVPPAYVRVAMEQGVPPELLYAVALTESGYSVPNVGHRPWPWTLNVAGKPYRYPNRASAEAALRQHLSQTRLIDIGVMQINWRWHRDSLVRPDLALDPWYSLRIAATLLRRLHGETGDWVVAAGRYHSPGPSAAQRQRAARYSARVRHHLAALRPAP